MKASKFTDAQKAFIIKQGEEGTPVAEIWLQARACAARPRRLRNQHQEGLSHLQGVGHAAQAQDAETPGEGKAAR